MKTAPTRDKSGRFTGITYKPPGCGRVQKAVRRTFIANGYQPLTIRAFLPRCYPKARRYVWWMRTSVHHALRRSAVSLGRQAHMQGRPILWRLK